MTAARDDTFGDDDNDYRVEVEEEERGEWVPIPLTDPQVFKNSTKLFEALKKLGF